MNSRFFLGPALGLVLLSTVVALPRDAQAVAFPEWDGFALGVWSNPVSWDPNVAPATGDYLKFGEKTSGGRITNDLTNFSATRLTFSGRDYTIQGNPLHISESIVVEEGSTTHSIELDISGVAATLVAKGGALKLSGNNSFTGQVDVDGTLDADSNGALGSIVGGTRILPGGNLSFSDRDLGLEPIQVSGTEPLFSCAIINGGGNSVLRDIQIGSGRVCFTNFSLGNGTISYPNGIGQFTSGFDLLLMGGRHVVSGASSAAGPLRVTGETDLIWNSNAAVAISFEPFLDFLPEGDLRGGGEVASVDFRGGTFGGGTGTFAAAFTINGFLKIQDATLRAQLNSEIADSGYSQVELSGPVMIGPNTDLELVLGFEPAAGQQFRIIDDLGDAPISGTFEGLPEGATFSRAGKTWTITYKGGDGNDVVITRATDTPADPLPFKRRMVMVARG